MEKIGVIGIIFLLAGARVVTGAIRRVSIWLKSGKPKSYEEKINQTSKISIEEALAFSIGSFLLALWARYQGRAFLFLVLFFAGAFGIVLTSELIRFSYKLDRFSHRQLAGEANECERFSQCIKGQFLLVPHVYHQVLSPLRSLIFQRWQAWLERKQKEKENEEE